MMSLLHDDRLSAVDTGRLKMQDQTVLLHCWTRYPDNRCMLYVSKLQVFKCYSLLKFTLSYDAYLLTLRHAGATAFSSTEHL